MANPNDADFQPCEACGEITPTENLTPFDRAWLCEACYEEEI